MPNKSCDLHVWFEPDDYAYLRREARLQDRSMGAVVRRLVKFARLEESMEAGEEMTRAEPGAVAPTSGGGCRGCAS